METWTGIQQHNGQRDDDDDDVVVVIGGVKPKSILRKPKYSQKVAAQESNPSRRRVENYEPTTTNHRSSSTPRQQQQQQQSLVQPPVQSTVPVAVVQDVVVERPPRKRKDKTKTTVVQQSPESAASATTMAIEGYSPKTSSSSSLTVAAAAAASTKNDDITAQQDNDDVSDEPLVFNSMADLMEKAGTLPIVDEGNSNTTEPNTVLEAELEFSCVDPEDYQAMKDEEVREHYDVFLGRQPQDFLADHDKENSEDEGDEGDLWDLLNNGSDEEEVVSREPRAFLKLWEALSQWVTPEAVRYVRHLQQAQSDQEYTSDWVPQYDRSDVGASRCAGLMAMLQMHTSKALEELNQSPDVLRLVERRLADLLRCFDYSRPMPNLDMACSKAMACILLDTVLVETQVEDCVPASCQTLGMTIEEYRYLTRSAIVNFGTPSDQ